MTKKIKPPQRKGAVQLLADLPVQAGIAARPIRRRIKRRARPIHQATVAKAHATLTQRYSWYKRWHNHRYHHHAHVAVLAVALIAVMANFGLFHFVNASGSTWTQSDWSGGVGTSTSNQFSAEANATTGTANQVTLPQSLTFSGNEITDASRTTNTQGDGVTPPDSSTGIWQGTTNLIRNGGFESNLNDWAVSNGSGSASTISQVSGGKFGSDALQYSATANTGAWAQLVNKYYSYNTAPYFNTADQYTLSFWAKQTSGTAGAVIQPYIADSTSTNYVLTTQSATLTSAWKRYTYTFTPALAGNQPEIIFATPTPFTEIPYTYLIDGVQLEQYPAATPYVDTNGATASRGAARVQAAASTLNSTQGWFAARVRMDFASSQTSAIVSANSASASIRLFQWQDSSTNRLVLTLNSSNQFTVTRTTSAGGTTATASGQTFSAGTIYTIIAKWTAGDVYISINGGAFTAAANTTIPTIAATTFDIGGAGGADNADSDYLWSAAGTGTLANGDATTLNALGNTDPSFSSLSSLNSGAASPTMAWDGTSSTYATTGTLTSSIFDSGLPENWGNLSYSATIPSGTSVSVQVRGGNQSNLSDASAWTSCSPVSSGSDATSSCLPDKTRYAQYQVTFTSSNTATPTLNSISLGYAASDVTPPPTNASALAIYQSNGGSSLANNAWTNADPYFTWTAGADDSSGSGIGGYCLYLGQDSTGDPVTTKGDLGASPVNSGGSCQYEVSGTNFDSSLTGALGTALTSSNTPYYLNIKAIDNAGNVYTGSSAQTQFRYDNTVPTNPSFISAPSEFVSNKQVTLTWSTTGSDAASDANSGLAGLQYRIGSTGTWYGASHSGTQDATDLLPNNGSYTTVSSPDFTNLQDGNNIVYFRTWDNAGNVSSAYVTTVIKINTTAPSSPQNLTPTPSTNTLNSFGFSWLAPATFTGSASNITYCYTVNVLPTSSNCTYTAAGVTSLDAGAYATEPGDNTFYLVAKDEAGNINYATAASATFTANTAAPGVPLNPDIADISVKSTSNWKLALSWETPSSVGAGVATYKIYRSTNDSTFTDIASTAGTSYVDSGLNPETYYYKVQACDSANNCGAFTDVVSQLPTGKFTSPANLISGPTVAATTRTATITYTTDRDSDSSVEYGLSSGHYFTTEAANTNQVTSHSVGLNSLTAGTTYYFRAMWTDTDGNTGTSAEGSFTTLPAPTTSNVAVGNVNLTTATIQFTSNNATAVQLEYGGGILSNTQNLNTSTSTSTYSIPLNGLAPGTTYTFRLNPYDTSGNIYQSTETHTFTTPPQPAITNIEFQPVPGALTGTEQVSWTTNVPTTSDITYGQQGQATQEAIDSSFVTSHTMTMADLPYNTPYTLVARSTDQLGNLATSDQQVFHTGLDTRPPVVSGLTVQPSIRGTGASAQGQLVVSWHTDKAGTSQVEYGEGSSGDYSSKTAEDTNQVTNHVVVVSDLSTSQVYHLRVLSSDANGVQGVSTDQTTIIGQATDSALGIVFNALQAIFGL